MTKDEALKLALEALEAAYARIVTKCEQNLVTYNGVDVDTLTLSQEAITAIKEALANEALDKMAENARELGLDYEPEQDWIERERAVGYREGHQNAIKQMAQPEQEPVGKFAKFTDGIWREVTDGSAGVLLYTTPQRTWVGLEQEIAIAVLEHCYPPMVVSSDMIERTTEVIKAKLKEKNT